MPRGSRSSRSATRPVVASTKYDAHHKVLNTTYGEFADLRRELADPKEKVAERENVLKLLGSCWPCSSFSFGLGSKRSIWLGPPSRKMKMQALALGAKCGGLAANGFAASAAGCGALLGSAARSNPSSVSIDASAQTAAAQSGATADHREVTRATAP